MFGIDRLAAGTVSGDFGPDLALSRDADGVWSGSVGPLKPDEYVYSFTIDGVRLTDPAGVRRGPPSAGMAPLPARPAPLLFR